MHNPNYEICSYALGNGRNGKVYKIREINPPHTILIAKIYEYKKRAQFEKEKFILNQLSNQNNNTSINDYLVHNKNINVRLRTSEFFRNDSTLLTFDFYVHGKILDYISFGTLGKPLCEIYTKLLAYKILLGLKTCHENNIIHNSIEMNNIMFDENFNPKIIHFGEAKMGNNYEKDFYKLGMVLAELLTSRQIISYKYYKKLNKYIFQFYSIKNNFQEGFCEESKFWKTLELTRNIKLSQEFINFFHLLVSSDKIYKIDDLLNNEWLKEARLHEKEIEKNLKEEFKNNYYIILQSNKLLDKYYNNINLNLIINREEMNDPHNRPSLINEFIDNDIQLLKNNSDSLPN